MTIPPISADDITIKQIITIAGEESDLNWGTATVDETTGERTFNLKFHCPTAIPEGTTITTNNVGSISNFNVDNQTATFKVNKKWDTQSLNISIGDAVKEGLLTVPAIEAADISITSSPAEWTEGTSDYTLTVGVKGNVTLESSDFSATNATISTAWNSSTSTLKIKPAAQSWTVSQGVSLTVHGLTGNVFTIPLRKIKEGNIQWGAMPTWNVSTASYDIPVSGMIQLSGDPSKPGRSQVLKDLTVSVSIGGTVNSGITGSYDSNTKKFTISGDVLTVQDWSAQQVTLNISGEHIDGTISKDIFAIPAKKITSDYFSLTPATPATWASGNDQNTEYTIKVALNGSENENAPPIDTFAAGLTVKQNTTALTVSWVKDESGAYVLDDGKYQLKLKGFKNISQDWSDKNISVSITGTNIDSTITADALTVPAKVAADYITVTDTNPNAWAANTASVTFKVAATQNSGVSITGVYFGETQLTAANNVYTIDAAEGSSIAQDVTIKITTNHGDVTKRIFPISGTENRFFGRTISINGMQEVYTFADTPSSVAAMQTRIIELPAVVQKAWESFSEEKEEVAAVVAPTSEVVQSKKSSKKVSKKAAKKAVEAVTETAAALEVTELPVEALEEAKADDQLAMILPQTANTEEAELVEPQASVSAVDVSVTEAEPASEKHSSAAIWVVLLAVLSSVAGLIFLKKRKVSV